MSCEVCSTFNDLEPKSNLHEPAAEVELHFCLERQ